jgi:hypothetical protein
MQTMTFYMPTKIIIGAGVINQVGAEVKKLGKKALIVTYPDIRRVGILDKVLANLNANDVEAVVFDKVESNPRSATIDEGATIARGERIDLIIGLGGGSVMDSAKAIAAAYNGTVSVWDYIEDKAKIKEPVPPIIQVPTMSGTGSEIAYGAVITNWKTHVKRSLHNLTSYAKVAIIDPEIMLTVPMNQTKAGALDSFAHMVEPYITDPTPQPLTDGIRETVMKVVVQNLPKVITKPDDVEARGQLAWASTMATAAFGRLGGGGGEGTCHGIEHALSGYYDVTHGAGLAALLPAWMRFHLPYRKGRLDLLAKNVFGKKDGIRATEEWLQSVGMRLRLRDLGCELDHAEEIAELAVKSSGSLASSSVPIDAVAIKKIYCESF